MTIISEDGKVAVNYNNLVCLQIDESYCIRAYAGSRGEFSILLARGGSEARASKIFNHILDAESSGVRLISVHDLEF